MDILIWINTLVILLIDRAFQLSEARLKKKARKNPAVAGRV